MCMRLDCSCQGDYIKLCSRDGGEKPSRDVEKTPTKFTFWNNRAGRRRRHLRPPRLLPFPVRPWPVHQRARGLGLPAPFQARSPQPASRFGDSGGGEGVRHPPTPNSFLRRGSQLLVQRLPILPFVQVTWRG